jgi:Cu+-exporting ATPase
VSVEGPLEHISWRYELTSISEVLAIILAAALTGVMGWDFFGPKKSRTAEIDDGVEVVRVTVKGGYSPDVIRGVPGVPALLAGRNP